MLDSGAEPVRARQDADLYLWYDTIPDVDPTAFGSPEAYLEAIRYRSLDRTFSYITSRESSDAFYSESQYIGFGFSTTIAGSARGLAAGGVGVD